MTDKAPVVRQVPEGASVAFLSANHSWVLGKVIAYDQKLKTYKCESSDPKGIVADKLKPDEIWHARTDDLEQDVNDLLELTELHEASLLFCLKRRHARDVVYTNIGPIVVALNPFNYNIPWYKDDVMPQYLGEGTEIEKNLPHTWASAHNTYWEMKENRQNQTILISGESGAGKTEAAKIVVKYLGALSTMHGTKQQQDACQLVNTKLLASSPILESFGNAKTLRNDNSSRFGKFMKIQFDRDGFLIGSFATKYLLEKSRIISAATGERVYHSFYQLAVGEDAKTYGLRSAKLYKVLNSGECLAIPGLDDAEEYTQTKKAMGLVGISDEDQKGIWRIVGGILFLLNVDFLEKEDKSGKIAAVDETSAGFLSRAAELWDIPEDELERELLQTMITARNESTAKNLTKPQAIDTRDTICKSLYDWLFDWLIDSINLRSDSGDRTDTWIGLLDIFGFEDFEKNYFEQLCINLANETLQNHYNNHIFTEDMKECQEEGIDVSAVSFIDNRGCIELLTGKIGVLTLLDEECKVNGSEANFLQKITANFVGTKQKEGNPYFLSVAGKNKDNCFRIKHYAGDVTYSIVQMLEKNRDTLKDAVKVMLMKSKVPLVASIVPPPNDTGRPSSKFTVGGYFVRQLQELMTLIHSTHPHWIRCIKPDPSKKPLAFNHASVMSQLRSAGVLDTVKVRKAGYPIRFKKDLFVQRYKILTLAGDDPELRSTDKTAVCRALFKKLNITQKTGQLGKTKIFLRQEAFTDLNHAKDKATEIFAMTFQALGRASAVRHQLFAIYVQVHKAKILAERKAREDALRRQKEEEERQRRAEEEERARRERLQRELRQRAAVTIQRHVRGMLTRNYVFMYFYEQERSKVETAMDNEFKLYRSAWDHVDAHVSQLERRENEKQEKHWRNDLEEYVRFQHPEYLKERRDACYQKLEELAEKKRRQAEREELAAKNRAKEALEMRRSQKETAATKAAELRRQQAKLRAAHREKAANAEQTVALAAARDAQQLQKQREDFEKRYLEQLREMKEQAHHDPRAHWEFDEVKNEWARNERWEHERERRFVATQSASTARKQREDAHSLLVASKQFSYVPNLALSPLPGSMRPPSQTQRPASSSASRSAPGPAGALTPQLASTYIAGAGRGSTLKREEVLAERHYRESVLEDAFRNSTTIEVLRRHARREGSHQ